MVEMKALPKQAILVVNTMSRSGAEGFDDVRDKLAAAGIELLAAHKKGALKTRST